MVGAHHAAGPICRVDDRDLVTRGLELQSGREPGDARPGHHGVDPRGAHAHTVLLNMRSQDSRCRCR